MLYCTYAFIYIYSQVNLLFTVFCFKALGRDRGVRGDAEALLGQSLSLWKQKVRVELSEL